VKTAPPHNDPLQSANRKINALIVVFAAVSIVLAIGFQLHFFFNSAPVFKKFAVDLSALMPVFWIGFSIGMFPASLITKRFGGLPVMCVAAIVGAAAIFVMEFAGTLEIAVAAQFVAGAMWGCILMSAFAAALAIGYTGAEGKTTGMLFSTLAIATFARMAVTATGTLNNPTLAPLVHWAPAVCWTVAGVVLLALLARPRRTKELY
jgi:MFS family permease